MTDETFNNKFNAFATDKGMSKQQRSEFLKFLQESQYVRNFYHLKHLEHDDVDTTVLPGYASLTPDAQKDLENICNKLNKQEHCAQKRIARINELIDLSREFYGMQPLVD